MSRRPQHRHIDDLTRAIREAPLRDIGRRLTAAIDIDRRGGPATIDGYPTSTMGGSGGNAELTSVESAAAMRIVGRHRDPIHDTTIAACTFLEDAVRALHACVNTLDRLDALRAVGPDSGEPGCESCQRHPRSDGQPTWEAITGTTRTDVGGRLADARYLCRWCSDYVRAMSQLPTRDELATHHGGRNVRRTA